MPITINGSAGTITGISAGGLPDGCIQSADLASGVGGKVLQVLHMTTTTDANNNNHNVWVDSGLTQDITMTNASNKVLVIVNLFVYISCTGASEIGAYAKLLRGSTELGSSNGTSAHFPLNTGGGDDAQAQIPLQYYDTPGSGTHTYKVQGKPYSSDNNLTMQGGGDMYSTLTLMEIAA